MNHAEEFYSSRECSSFLSFCRQAMLPDDYFHIEINKSLILWSECLINSYGEKVIKVYARDFIAIMIQNLKTLKWKETTYWDMRGI